MSRLFAAFLALAAAFCAPDSRQLWAKAPTGDSDSEIFAVATISDINRLMNTVMLYATLEIDVNTGVVLEDKDLLCFSNYLDYQWVGAGKTAYIYPGRIASFVSGEINAGTAVAEVCRKLLREFESGQFNVDLEEVKADEDDLRMKVGAYLVGEVEYHQEPDGAFLPLVELNQAKFFFSGHYKSRDKAVRSVDFLAEFNPLPEEVIHHVDQLLLPHNGHTDTLTWAEPTGVGQIPFERLQFSLDDVASSGLRLTFGQIRNPFGIWSDFSSHRNFASAKSNLLVNGFALKKIELGLQLDRDFGPFSLTAAVVHGRMGRTAPLFRVDADERVDGVFRASWGKNGIRAGVSAYLAEFNVRRSAFGADFSAEMGRLLLGAEVVYQQNHDFGDMVALDDAARMASSWSGYAQADFAISSRLHVYALHDIWAVQLDGNLHLHPVYRAFHGLRFYVLKNVRWTIAELGILGHGGFDEGKTHMSTQLEVTF